MKPVAIPLLIGLSAASGCVSTGPSEARAADRNLISLEEIEPHTHRSAFETIRILRPTWLQSARGGRSTFRRGLFPFVFLDGAPYGPISDLRSIGSSTLEEIRFVSPADATTRWGTGYQGGVIAVTTRRSPKPGSPIVNG